VLAGRLLGAVEYGHFTTAAAFITIAAAAGAAGHAERAMRVAAAARDDPERRRARAHYVLRTLLGALPLALALVLPIGLVAQVPVWVTLVVGLPTAALLAVIQTLEAFTRGAFTRTVDLVPWRVGNPVLFTVGCGALLVLDLETDALDLLVFRLLIAAAAVAYFVARLRVGPRTPAVARDLEPLGGFAAAQLLFTVQGQVSILVAGLVSASAAGAYTAAFRTSTPVAAAAIALGLLTAPLVAAAAQEDRLSSVAGMVRRYSRMGFAVAAPLSVVAFVWPDEVLRLFGEEFTGAADALRVLSAVRLFSTLFGPVNVFAVMAGLEREAARWMAVAVAVQLVLSLALLAGDELTVTRLAWIDGLGTIVWTMGLWLACRRRFGVTSAAF
jgi:O-antigen/teichoic acid export membrane protein